MGSSIDLKQMQKIEFDILRTVHTLCQENHITYYLGYGTMLGAVRHQGFIPWDDDVDIVMPRDDYRRFLQLAPQYLPEHLKLCHLGNTAPYNYDFAKIQDKRTILIEDTYSCLLYTSGRRSFSRLAVLFGAGKLRLAVRRAESAVCPRGNLCRQAYFLHPRASV